VVFDNFLLLTNSFTPIYITDMRIIKEIVSMYNGLIVLMKTSFWWLVMGTKISIIVKTI